MHKERSQLQTQDVIILKRANVEVATVLDRGVYHAGGLTLRVLECGDVRGVGRHLDDHAVELRAGLHALWELPDDFAQEWSLATARAMQKT